MHITRTFSVSTVNRDVGKSLARAIARHITTTKIKHVSLPMHGSLFFLPHYLHNAALALILQARYEYYVYFWQVLFATPHADVVPFLTPAFVLSLTALHGTDADPSMPKTRRFAATLRWNSSETCKPRVTFRCNNRINLQPYANPDPEDMWECPAEAEAVWPC